ncbi:hypothetical protein TRAPUB_6240 [Trametes pubescens]|uniref:Uncharacterized protein n=1 Tax=Trametes pubescens TaxID=154538 RepID=A0A1M2V6I4_TRAPU|nr:hypothetical protein TRAPUB_6240 [Trametes pubescens]
MLIVSTRQNAENNASSYPSHTTIRFRGSRSTRVPRSIGVEIDLERVDTDGRSPGQRTFDGTRDVYTTQDKDSMV